MDEGELTMDVYKIGVEGVTWRRDRADSNRKVGGRF